MMGVQSVVLTAEKKVGLLVADLVECLVDDLAVNLVDVMVAELVVKRVA